MRLSYLSWRERWGIVRTLRKLRRTHISASENSRGLTAPGDRTRNSRTFRELLAPGYSDTVDVDSETIGAWLRRQGQSERAIERFWSVVLVSALGETVDRASLAAARKVFVDGFLASRTASDLLLPRLPLGEIFHTRSASG